MNYGNLLINLEEYEESVNLYQRAILLQKDYADVYYNLAFALEKLNRISEASLYYGKNAYYEGRIEQAFEYFEQYRLSEYADLDFYNELGNYYQAQRKQNELIPIAKEGIQKYPESIRQRLYLINAYQRQNRQDIALKLSDEAIHFFQDEPKKSFIFEVFKQGILPIIYNTMDEIEIFRRNYIENLNLLITNIAIEIEDESQKAFAMFILRNRNNYYLHYQNKNDLEIQIKYADFVKKTMKIFYSNWLKFTNYIALNTTEKIRIGYLCHRSHGLGQLFLNWIKHRNSEKFETYFYDIGSVVDVNTESFRLYSNYYYHIPNDFEKLLEKIQEDSLHILVFLDIGIEPELCCLSALKLAPIQCSTWGHPITSGSSQIDYFLASDAMEPQNAQEHYSEKVVRLPNLGISIPSPEIPQELKTRSEFELQEGDILYVSCQMTAKYLPQHDYLFCEIVKQVPQAKILFSEAYESPEVNQKFKDRLKRKFDTYGLNINDFCLFKPRINPVDYRNLLCISDVFLDTLGWSGGLTSLDAIACNLPLVTLPGEFMRGRQSYGMLQIIGVTETVAKTEEDYIKIAVRLGSDAVWRQTIKDALKANSFKLFNDLTCVEALENFYEQIVQRVYHEY
jgi:predicted O-linked N-acetylglucosamine transferase (SPINDLY family)